MKKLWFILLFCVGFADTATAQRGVGFRFSTEFNHFFRSNEHPELIDGSWSHIVIGPYYQAYFNNGGLQIGLNFIHKNDRDTGWPNMPVVQRDYNGSHNVGVTGLEMDFKAGPSFGPFNPKIGYLLGYRFYQGGFLNPGQTAELHKWYLALPFGFTIDLPTEWGSTGIGFFYDVGMTSVMKNPNPGLSDYDGGRIRSINFEIWALWGSKRQKPKGM